MEVAAWAAAAGGALGAAAWHPGLAGVLATGSGGRRFEVEGEEEGGGEGGGVRLWTGVGDAGGG